MSYSIVDEIIEQTLFPAPEKWVLISLASHANGDTRCAWPSVGTMARQADVSERTVQRSLRYFEKLGAITDVTQYSEDPTGTRKRSTKYGGSGRSCCYQINDLGSKEILDKLLADWRKREAARDKRSKKRKNKTPSRWRDAKPLQLRYGAVTVPERRKTPSGSHPIPVRESPRTPSHSRETPSGSRTNL